MPSRTALARCRWPVLIVVTLLSVMAGCDQPAAKGPAGNLAVPAPPLPQFQPPQQVQQQPQQQPPNLYGFTANDLGRPLPAKSAGMSASPKTVAFLDFNRAVCRAQDDIRATLLSVVDDTTAQVAAKKLPEQIAAWDAAIKPATKIFLTLSDSEVNAVFGLAVDEMTANVRQGDPNMLQIMQRLAHSPQRPILQDSLIQLRDAFLAQNSFYAPQVARERMAMEFGNAGDALP